LENIGTLKEVYTLSQIHALIHSYTTQQEVRNSVTRFIEKNHESPSIKDLIASLTIPTNGTEEEALTALLATYRAGACDAYFVKIFAELQHKQIIVFHSGGRGAQAQSPLVFGPQAADDPLVLVCTNRTFYFNKNVVTERIEPFDELANSILFQFHSIPFHSVSA
jgi:protoheme ferro-lyase